METKLKLLLFTLLIAAAQTYGQDSLGYNRAGWLTLAEQLKPNLTEQVIIPCQLVNMVSDRNAFQGYKAVATAIRLDSVSKSSFKNFKTLIFDLGNHYTGKLTFKFDALWGSPDGPVRVKLTFGEVPADLAVPYEPYTGSISGAWLQEEVVTLMDATSEYTLPRRVSCRFIKIELMASSPYFDIRLSEIKFKAVTSVNTTPSPLASSTDSMIMAIDRIGLNTLKECMQTVYEDGPKRDRRLWIGDLYLESLANMYSFKNYDLTKRCLYLLAGLSGNEGYLIGTVFETPEPHAQANQYLFDYALLYNVALKEYVAATNDLETGRQLWPVAKRQLDIIYKYLQPNGLMDYNKANSQWWLFFDWKDGLHKEVALQGISIFALQQTYELAKILNHHNELKTVPEKIKQMKAAARKQYYNSKTNLFESGTEQQISYTSQIWMTLAGVLPQTECQKNLQALINKKEAVYPGAPYMYHYFIQALIDAGMTAEARQYLVEYWGGMVKKGADTFWEVYDPKNELLSPYGFYPVNSYCHAWSCTPVYFIRKYPEIFQK